MSPESKRAGWAHMGSPHGKWPFQALLGALCFRRGDRRPVQAPEWVRRAKPAGPPCPSPRPGNDVFAEVAFCNQHSSVKQLPYTHFADNKSTSSRGQGTAQGPKATQQQHRGSCHLFDAAWAPAQAQARSSQGPSQRTVAGCGPSLCAPPCHF